MAKYFTKKPLILALFLSVTVVGVAYAAVNFVSSSFGTAPTTCPAQKRTITAQDVTNIVNSGYPAGTQTYVPGGPDPWGGCFPNASNTGVPAGTTLTAYTGDCDIRTDGTVINAMIITDGCDGRFLINASNVTITNSRFVGIVTIDVLSGSLTITDSEADFGADPWGQGLAGNNITAQRLHFYGGHRQVFCGSCIVEDSYFHGQNIDLDPVAHASAARTGAYTTYRHNTLHCDLQSTPEGGGCSAAQTGYPDFGPIHHNTVERNLIIGSESVGYCAYGGWNPGKPYNDDPDNATYITFRDNVITRGTIPNDYQDWQYPVTHRNRYTCGHWNATTSYKSGRPGFVFTGNMWDDGLLLEDDTDTLKWPWHE